jgi:hypothetical protein
MTTKSEVKDPNLLAKVNPTAAPMVLARPAFLDARPVEGVEEMSKYITYPRLKIIQKMAARETLDKFDIGSLVLMPDGVVVAPIGKDARGRSNLEGAPLRFIPIAFFEQWCTWGDIKDRSKGNPILDSTTDPNHPIAIKARNKDTREEIRGTGDDQKKIRHVEHLNFLVKIHHDGNPADGQLAMMSFARGSHRDGRNLAKLIKMRRTSPFYCIFEMKTKFVERDGNDWYVPNIDNPSEGSAWVEDQATADQMKEMHESAMTLIKSNRINVVHDDEDATATENVELEASEV